LKKLLHWYDCLTFNRKTRHIARCSTDVRPFTGQMHVAFEVSDCEGLPRHSTATLPECSSGTLTSLRQPAARRDVPAGQSTVNASDLRIAIASCIWCSIVARVKPGAIHMRQAHGASNSPPANKAVETHGYYSLCLPTPHWHLSCCRELRAIPRSPSEGQANIPAMLITVLPGCEGVGGYSIRNNCALILSPTALCCPDDSFLVFARHQYTGFSLIDACYSELFWSCSRLFQGTGG
jgi:hypothetical protein